MRINTALTTFALASSLAFAACTSNGTDSGGIIGGDGSTGGPVNNGNGGTSIVNNSSGSPVAVSGHFVCTGNARAFGGAPHTVVGTDGLVGSSLTSLLNTLGGSTVTTLLNSVINPNNVIDGDLNTFATFQLTAGLLSPTIDSVDLSVVMDKGVQVPAGNYAVFGISFPAGTADLGVGDTVVVTTSLNGTVQESNTLTQALLLSLLGANISNNAPVWLGIQTSKAYDTATLSVKPNLVAVTAGDRLHAYELCTEGSLK